MDGEEVSPKGRPIPSDAEVEELVRIPKYIPDSVKDPFKPKRTVLISGPLLTSSARIKDTNSHYPLEN